MVQRSTTYDRAACKKQRGRRDMIYFLGMMLSFKLTHILFSLSHTYSGTPEKCTLFGKMRRVPHTSFSTETWIYLQMIFCRHLACRSHQTHPIAKSRILHIRHYIDKLYWDVLENRTLRECKTLRSNSSHGGYSPSLIFSWLSRRSTSTHVVSTNLKSMRASLTAGVCSMI